MKGRRKANANRSPTTAGIFEEMAHARKAVLVGLGNIGSRLAVELPLIGVRRLVLIDPDRVSDRNLACCSAFVPADIGRLKVEVLAKRLKESRARLNVTAFARTLNVLGLAYLRDATPGVLVGAVDSRRARLELAEAAMLLGMPLVDVAIAQSREAMLARVQVTWWAAKQVDPLNAWSDADWEMIEQRQPCPAAEGPDADHPVASPVSGTLAAALAAGEVRRLLRGDVSNVGREIRVDLGAMSVVRCALPRDGPSPLDPTHVIDRAPIRCEATILAELVAEAERVLGTGAEVILNRQFSDRSACAHCGLIENAPGPVDARPCPACGRQLVAVNPVESLSHAAASAWANVPVERLGVDRDLLRAISGDGSRQVWLEYGRRDRQ